MDPIHPIVPIPPNIPPVAPAPMIGRIDRDAPHARREQDNRRRRRAQPERTPGTTEPDALDYAVDDDDEDGNSGLHINVTA